MRVVLPVRVAMKPSCDKESHMIPRPRFDETTNIEVLELEDDYDKGNGSHAQWDAAIAAF